ncbi:MAG: radical SAM protein [Proteobacteria bacterium]|nr:radical SAM protein [Pseudomonadota bacterium]
MLLTSNPILNKALEGQRITSEEALELFENADLLDLAYVANEKRQRLHPDSEAVTYVVQRNVNYSNVCTASCSFCAFYTYPGVDDKSNPAYTLDYETQIKPKIAELVAINGTEILLQGGHNPELGLDYYQELFINIKRDFPSVTLHALSPSEINHIAEKYFTSVSAYGDGTKIANIKEPILEEIKTVLLALKEAGMDSLPGAGAEILTERVRLIIAPKKINSQRWLDIMEVAHSIGFKSSATMMYGHVETYEDRVEHLKALRDLQDRTNGFTAFVLWNFQRGDTPLGKIMNAYERDGKLPKYNKDSSGEEYLRSLAVSRIFLDNFKNFQASWVTQGHEIGQLSLNFGCNDLGGNMMEENVVSAANTTYRTSVQQMEYFIEACGRKAVQRDTQYNLVN